MSTTIKSRNPIKALAVFSKLEKSLGARQLLDKHSGVTTHVLRKDCKFYVVIK
jgi:hypothetical protein